LQLGHLGGWLARLRGGLGRLHRLVHHRLPGGGEPLHHLRGAVHDAHRPADRLDRELAGAHGVLDGLGDPGEVAGRAGALGVLAVEELDVIQNLVAALVAQRVEQPADALLEEIVHGTPTFRPCPRPPTPAPPRAWRGTWCGRPGWRPEAPPPGAAAAPRTPRPGPTGCSRTRSRARAAARG